MTDTQGKPLLKTREELEDELARVRDALADSRDELNRTEDERDKLRAELESAQQRYETLRLAVVNPPFLLFQEKRSYVYQPSLGVERCDQAMRLWEEWWNGLSLPLLTEEECEDQDGEE